MKYFLYCDDNAHYMDTLCRVKSGEYETYEECLKNAKKIIDDFLTGFYTKGQTPADLFDDYKFFGEDPLIRVVDGELKPGEGFDGWDYAEKRCKEICD